MAKKMSDDETGSEDALHGISAIYEADRRRHRLVTATDNQLHGGNA